MNNHTNDINTNEISYGTLYIVATPIGNLEDITHRALRILSEVDALACEDTREARKIYSRYNIPFPRIFFAYHEHNEVSAGRKIIKLLTGGKNVALCTDAGMPGISDPGYRVIAEGRELGCPVDIIPGPNAVTTALISSGLPPSSFTFKGFPPRKSGQRKRFLEMEKDQPHTLIFFESPHRLSAFLGDALEVLGNRQAAVCIDLTKMFQEVRKDHLDALCAGFADQKIKGEITVVIAGNNPKFTKKQDKNKQDKQNQQAHDGGGQ